MKIRIETLTDSWDCDICGPAYAYGARVYFDDKLAIDMSPTAHCYDGDSYTEEEIFKAILSKLGHTVEVLWHTQ